MASKYAELEGYDTYSSEVYETGNLDEKKEINNNLYNTTLTDPSNESINDSEIEIEKAKKYFSNAEEKNISKQYEINYLAGKIEKSQSQSLSQQLRRLIKEVDELKTKIEKEKINHPEVSVEESNTEPAQEPEGVTAQENTEKVEGQGQVEAQVPSSQPQEAGTTSPSKKVNKTSPSYMLDQASKLQSELEKLTLGIVNDNGQGVSAIENILMQQKMINQIKVCKINALKENDGSDMSSPEKQESVNVPETAMNAPSTTMTSSDGITYKLYYSPQSMQYHHLARISDLEERITQIETILGINSITNDNILFPSNNQISTLLYAKGNIVTAIDSLDQQLQLLSQPSNFDSILLKVNEAIKELEQFINIQKNKLTEEKIEEQAQIKEKVDSLYSKLESTEEYSAIISPLLTRLKTLQALHTEASQFSESVQMFSEQQNSIKNQIKDLHDMMSNLSESLEVNKTIIENNIDSISKRVDQLMDRVKEL